MRLMAAIRREAIESPGTSPATIKALSSPSTEALSITLPQLIPLSRIMISYEPTGAVAAVGVAVISVGVICFYTFLYGTSSNPKSSSSCRRRSRKYLTEARKQQHTVSKGNGLIDAIGNTPLIRISSLSDVTGCEILAKAEFLNPGGSVKDRVAVRIIEEALQSGALVQGGVVTEGSAGSTAISLATVAPAYGCKCHVVIPDDAADEKWQILEALGAIVEKVRPVSITHKDHFVNIARRRALEANKLASNEKISDTNEIKRSANGDNSKKNDALSSLGAGCGGFFADQFENLANFRAHFEGTGPF